MITAHYNQTWIPYVCLCFLGTFCFFICLFLVCQQSSVFFFHHANPPLQLFSIMQILHSSFFPSCKSSTPAFFHHANPPLQLFSIMQILHSSFFPSCKCSTPAFFHHANAPLQLFFIMQMLHSSFFSSCKCSTPAFFHHANPPLCNILSWNMSLHSSKKNYSSWCQGRPSWKCTHVVVRSWQRSLHLEHSAGFEPLPANSSERNTLYSAQAHHLKRCLQIG